MRPNAEKQKIFADNADICICDSMYIRFFQKDVKAAEKNRYRYIFNRTFYDWTGVFNRAMSGRYL